mgnify:CR=1 FL=1
MAKNSLFWGKARGKLGEIVLYRAGGEQRSRTYVKKIKNPKSLAQMTQRVKLGACVAFFRSTSNILRYSFPNRPARQSGFNAFISETLPVASTAVPREFADQALSCPLDYRISKGSLVLPSGAFMPQAFNDSVGPVGLGLMDFPATSDSGLAVAANLSDVGNALSSWLNDNPDFATTLPNKFNICIIISEQVAKGCLQTTRVLNCEREGNSVTVSGNLLPTAIGSPICGKITNDDGDFFVIAPNALCDAPVSFAGAFISYTDVNGKLVVSNAIMNNLSNQQGELAKYKKNGDYYNQAIDELGVGVGDVLSTN